MDTATEQAIDWLVRLDSGHADEDDHHAFAHWLAQATAHQNAWATLQARLGGSVEPALAQLRHSGTAATAGRHALVSPIPTAARRRSVLHGGLAALLASTATGWLVNRQTPLTTLAADLRTGTGERGLHRLPDGSEITLDARSAVDIAYNDAQRLVRLRAGALVASVAPTGAARPFVVQSAQGTVQALGTRFMVRQKEDHHTLVHVMEHSVRITTRSGGDGHGGVSHTLHQGESARFSHNTITPLAAPRMSPDAWADGLIDVRDQPLADLVDALRPYMAGIVRVSPEAARLRVFGVFPLDRPAQVLQDLVDTHPVAIRHWGSWLTLVDMQHGNL